MQTNLFYYRYRHQFQEFINKLIKERMGQIPIRSIRVNGLGQNPLSIGMMDLRQIKMEDDDLLFIGFKYRRDFYWWADDTRSKPSDIIRFVIANTGVD